MSRQAVATLLASGGAPAALADPVLDALGDEAAEILAADPWRLLEVRAVRPEQADAFARTLLGTSARPDDPRRAAAVTGWHLWRAAADGHTAMPEAPLTAALAGSGLPDPRSALAAAVATERIVAVPEDPTAAEARTLFALADLARAEEAVAEGLERLMVTVDPLPGTPFGESGVTAVIAPYPAAGSARRLTADAERAYESRSLRVVRASAKDLATRLGVVAAADVAVVDDAELLDVPTAAALLDTLPDGHRLVLVGDPELLPPRGPGQVLADLVASGVVPVRPEPPLPDGSPQIAALVQAVRAGELPVVDDPERRVVVVPATDETAVLRTTQLVSDSIPRVVGVAAEEILVVTPRVAGSVGASALDAVLTERLGARPGGWARTISDAHGARAPAVVAVFPAEAAGSLTRALVATAFGLAVRHLSVVAAAGAALRDSVERGVGRPRLTRLRGLLH